MRHSLAFLTRKFETLYTSSSEVRICCPFCRTEDTSYHLYINPDKGVAHCFRCEWAGTVLQLVSAVFKVPHSEAKRLLGTRPPTENLAAYESVFDRLRGQIEDSKVEPIALPVGYVPFAPHSKPVDKIGRIVLSYALNRNFTQQELANHAFGYSVHPTLMLRLVMPVSSTYWQARTLVPNAKRKYLNPPGDKGDSLFNSVALRMSRCAIAEGIFSAMRIGSNATAILGRYPNKKQLSRLKSAPVEIYDIHLDNGSAELASRLALQLLRAGKKVNIAAYIEGDPDDGVLGSVTDWTHMQHLRDRISGVKI